VGDGLNTAGYRFNVTGSDPYNKFVGRYDHQLVDHSSWGSHKIEFVANQEADSTFPDTFNSNEAPFPGGTNAGQSSQRWLAAVARHSTFANATNELRWGRQWGPVDFPREKAPTGPFISLATNSVPVSNYDLTFMSQGREQTASQIIDNFAIPKGRHLIRAG